MKSLFIFAIIFVSISSCTSKGTVHDFSDMFELRDSLLQIYPDEEIHINISNEIHMSVSFVNSDLKQLGNDEKHKIAQRVGLIARYFFDEKRITDGNLTFVVYKNYIIYTYKEAIDTYELWDSN